MQYENKISPSYIVGYIKSLIAEFAVFCFTVMVSIIFGYYILPELFDFLMSLHN